VPHVITKNRKI